jgi:sugar phosphate isomerase/epimerase
VKRRTFIATTFGAAAAWGATPPLSGELGVTTGSFSKHVSAEPAPGKLRLLDLPRRMRDELDLRVIDLMTATLASMEPAYLDKLRAAASDAGCVLTNLKMNQKELDLASEDEALSTSSLNEYNRPVAAAARLGVRWVRPASPAPRPDVKRLASGLRELMDYAGEKGIGVLIENNGWMKNDPNAIPAVIRETGAALRAQPDTGNWADEARYDGLAKAFPFAVSCDFKALAIEDGEHKAYDLQRCFRIGWDAGFRGPWCFEHFHADLDTLFRDLAWLRDRLRAWMK